MEATKTNSSKSKKALQGCGACSLILLFFAVIGAIIDGGNTPTETPQTVATESSNGEIESTVTLLGTDHNNAVENFNFLVVTADNSEENLLKIAQNVKSENCSKDCNLWFYDDESAYNLQKEFEDLEVEWREGMINGQLTAEGLQANIDSWNKEHYIFVADHYLGFLSFDSDFFWLYPYKDTTYTDLQNS